MELCIPYCTLYCTVHVWDIQAYGNYCMYKSPPKGSLTQLQDDPKASNRQTTSDFGSEDVGLANKNAKPALGKGCTTQKIVLSGRFASAHHPVFGINHVPATALVDGCIEARCLVPFQSSEGHDSL